MRRTFCTPFDEEYAKRCITLAFPELEWKLIVQNNDPPDLADIDRSVSVEVVRAVNSKDAELENTFVRYLGNNVNNVPDKLRKKVKNSHSGLICDNECNIVGVSFETKNHLYDIIEKCIVRKTEVLNSDRYPNFKTDCIFIYNSGGFCFENGLLELMEKIECDCQQYARQYKIIFIYCDHELYLCNQERRNIEVRKISDNAIKKMQKETLISIGREKEYNDQREFLIKR